MHELGAPVRSRSLTHGRRTATSSVEGCSARILANRHLRPRKGSRPCTEIALPAVALAAATPALANPVNASNPDWQISRRSGAECPPGLKFAADACVQQCPAGYFDNGRVCVFQNERH